MPAPRLTFACELERQPLKELFADAAVTRHLQAMNAAVSLGLLDLSEERAAVVRHLNEAGIPVVAWLLLPMEQGYWFNADNWPEAISCYVAFRHWKAEHHLRWAGVGLDFEPDINEMRMLQSGAIGPLMPELFKRLLDRERVRRAQLAYAMLAAQIRADGYAVESYQFSSIVDERKAGSTLLQRLFSIVDVPVDREVLMLYSSFMRRLGPANLWLYGPDAGGIGVGSTGGGVEGPDAIAPLTWDELARDLRLASRLGDHIFIFSLEGCAHQGFLSRLAAFDWDSPVDPPLEAARRLNWSRRGMRGILWASAHPWIVLGGLAGLIWTGSRLRSRKSR
jgi:hypothetical protein